jgi:outer membrane protein assembly factor BamE
MYHATPFQEVKVRPMPSAHPAVKAPICRLALALAFAACGLAGCSSFGFPGVYRINVEQGNIVTREMLDQLKPGMSRRQVRFVLGTPLLEDPFHSDRWDYIYTVRNGDRTLIERRLTVFFEGDTLTHFDSTHPPSNTADTEDNEEPATGDA